MPKFDYLARYSAHWMHVLLRSYFNQQANAEKFVKIHKYRIRLRPEDAREEPKTFCYTYRNKKNQKFGVFLPTHVDENPPHELPGITVRLKEALGFLIDYRAQRSRLEDEFFLLPLMDSTNEHWTVLKIILKKDGSFKAKYYDGTIRKKSSTYQHVQYLLRSLLNAPIKAPTLLEQVDTFNCGPLSFNMIKTLARGDEPRVLPIDPYKLRKKDFRTLVAASTEQSKYAQTIASPGPFPQFAQEKPDKPWWVRHRGKIVIAAMSLAVAITVALIIFFPPAILVPAVTAAASATGFSTVTMAALGATMLAASTAFVTLATSMAVDGVKSLWRSLRGKNKSRPEFVYDARENGFATVERGLSENAKNKMAEVKERDVLQMVPLKNVDGAVPAYPSPIASPRRRATLDERDFSDWTPGDRRPTF